MDVCSEGNLCTWHILKIVVPIEPFIRITLGNHMLKYLDSYRKACWPSQNGPENSQDIGCPPN